jgi:hypothetical protein
VAWATKALDEVRRALAAELRRTGHPGQATTIKKTRWALLKNPQHAHARARGPRYTAPAAPGWQRGDRLAGG